ncbi:MAG: Ycf66 family protein [Limnothrix sp.]
MLAQVLAIAVALGSTLLFLTAFIFPKLHRQDDFFWSAVGLFYALVLWVCAGQIVGAILLGQLASVVLLGWFAWETLRLRQAIIDPSKIPNLNKVSLIGYVKQSFNKPKPVVAPKTKAAKNKSESTPAVAKSTDTSVTTESDAAEVAIAPPTVNPTVVTETGEDASSTAFEQSESVAEAVEGLEEALADTDTEELDDKTIVSGIVVEVPEAADTPPAKNDTTESPEVDAKKGFSFGRLFGRKAQPVAVASNPQALDQILESEASEPEDVEALLTEAAVEEDVTTELSEPETTEAVDTVETPENEPSNSETPSESKEDS